MWLWEKLRHNWEVILGGGPIIIALLLVFGLGHHSEAVRSSSIGWIVEAPFKAVDFLGELVIKLVG